MELDFLEEWFAHLHRRGIDCVWVYYETTPIDSEFGDTKATGHTWAKKPEASCQTHLSDMQVMAKFLEICQGAPIPVRIRKSPGVGKSEKVGVRQHMAGNHAKREMRKMDYDWATFLDVDEYLVCRDLKRTLSEQPSSSVAVKMDQKVFDGRWDDKGNVILPSKIGTNYGLVRFNTKYFFRPKQLSKFGCVHHSKEIHPQDEVWANEKDLRFHHFRGLPAEPPVNALRRGIEMYYRLRTRGPQLNDFSHNK